MILHIFSPLLDKFTLPFIKLMDDNYQFIEGEHRYLFICRPDQIEGGAEGNQSASFLKGNVEFSHPDDGMSRVLKLMQESYKIIIHGLWREKINDLLVLCPELLKKSYWFMYGGDFFNKGTYSLNHMVVIKNIGFAVTHSDENFEFIKESYAVKAKHLSSFLYTSNLCPVNFKMKHRDLGMNFLIGHSGVEENQHLKCLKMLSKLDTTNMNIYCPLSYPKKNKYIDEVINYGEQIFGEKFIPLTNFISKESYENFISEKIDIAIMASWRGHGLGTITSLLASNAKVYLDSSSPSYKWFCKQGIKISSLADLKTEVQLNKIEKISTKVAAVNNKIVTQHFSKYNLLESLNKIWTN
jgi:dTDP-N-acetylfucosamine:lipid II N-acetylfucosaminyltransferase